MKIKSWQGKKQELKNLAKANALGKKGRNVQAEPIYAELYQHYPNHPGLLLDQSFGQLQAGEIQKAWHLLEASLDSCSNYGPTVRTMNQIQEAANQTASK